MRRLVFLGVETTGGVTTPAALFAITSARTPLFLADVDIHELVLLDTKELGRGTGWGDVPTPTFGEPATCVSAPFS